MKLMGFNGFGDMIMKRRRTIKGCLTAETLECLLPVTLTCLKATSHCVCIMLPSLMNLKISPSERLVLTPRVITSEHLNRLIRLRMPRCKMCLKGNLMKETVATVLAHMRAVIRVLLLQMIMKRGGIAIRMCRC